MQRLHCTFSQLLREPVEEMEVIKAFMLGEGDWDRTQAQAQSNKERVNVVG